MAESDFSRPYIIGYGSSPSRCGPAALPNGRSRDLPVPAQGASAHARVSDHAGSSGPRDVAPGHVAFHLIHGVGTQDETLFAAQWLAYALPCQRFPEALAGHCPWLGADVVRYASS